MKRFFFLILSFLLFVACGHEPEPAPGESSLTIKIHVEDSGMTDSLGIEWMSGGKAAVSGAVSPFSVRKTGDMNLSLEGYARPADEYAAIYPQKALKSFSGGDGSMMTAVVNIPYLQKAGPGMIPDAAGLMAGYAKAGADMTFRPLNNYIRFTVTEESGRIRSVTAFSRERICLSGDFSLAINGQYPELMPLPDSYSNVTLRSQGESLSPGDYYMALNTLSMENIELVFENDKGEAALYDSRYLNTGFYGHIFDLGEISGLEFKSWDQYPLTRTTILVPSNASVHSFGFLTKDDYQASVSKGQDWITLMRTKGADYHYIDFSVTENLSEERVGTIVVESRDGAVRTAFNIIQAGNSSYLSEIHRKALVDLYMATGGDGWTHNDNWCTDLPLNQWYGVNTDQDGAVTGLMLVNNNLSGKLPESIGMLAQSSSQLSLSRNNLHGTVPAGVFDFQIVELSGNAFTGIGQVDDASSRPVRYIHLEDNDISGQLPEFLGCFPLLYRLNLSNNRFTGTIPESYHDFISRASQGCFVLNGNFLSGKLPEQIASDYNFVTNQWTNVIVQQGEGFDLTSVTLKGPTGPFSDSDYEPVYLSDIYASNELTLIYDFYNDWDNIHVVKSWYQAYKDKGLAVVGRESASSSVLKQHAKEYGLEWPLFSTLGGYNLPFSPSLCLVDRDGNVVLNPLEADKATVRKFLTDTFGTPYSHLDGKVELMQKADEGNGIDIVFIGDAFTGDMIENGTYREVMSEFADHFFGIEPFTSFRHLFNLYSVAAVSPDALYHEGRSTALECYHDGATTGGNDDICKKYALKAISQERLKNALIIVAMNSDQYGGTCYLYPPEGGDYGEGTAIAYIPTVADKEILKGLIRHEAGGHGFAKLADEYYTGAGGRIPESEIEKVRSKEKYGWWRNCDFIWEPEDVKWAGFVADERYKSENLGVYEGALSYSKGVWRPSNTSIMRSNQGNFNAPSRYAIWYRIQKLAHGVHGVYEYEDFVEYDQKNL